MFSFLKRLLFPTRFDACCLVIAIHWFTVVFTMTVEPIFAAFASNNLVLAPINAVVATTWIALAAPWCWGGYSKERTWLLLASSLASLIFVLAWYWLNPATIAELEKGQVVGRVAFSSNGSSVLLSQYQWLVVWVLAVLCVLSVNFLFRFLAGRLSPYVRSVSDTFFEDRTKGLVVAAGVLFLAAILSRIQSNVGIGFQADQFDTAELAVSLFTASVVWFVAFFWFPNTWSTTGSPIQKSASVLLVLGGFIFWIVGFDEVPEIAMGVLVAFTFICTVVGIGGCKIRVEEAGGVEGADESAEKVRMFKPAFMPSVLSFALMLGLCFAISIPLVFGTGLIGVVISVFEQFNRKPTVSEFLELTMNSASTRWKSGGRIEFEFDSELMSPIWKVKFDSASPSDLLEALPSTGVAVVGLDGLTPEHELGSLKNGARYLVLKDCRISHSQLNAMLASVSSLELKGSLSIVDDGVSIDPGTLGTVSVHDAESGVFKKFFEATQCYSQVTWVAHMSPVTNEDWPAIAKAGQYVPVYLHGGWAPDFKLPDTQKSLGSVYCLDDTSELNPDLEKDLFLNTDINLYFYSTPLRSLEDAEINWKLWMLRGITGSRTIDNLFSTSNKPIDRFTRDLGMAYEVEERVIRSLYFPSGVSIHQIADLKGLRVLSFDPAWVKPATSIRMFGSAGSPTKIEHLGALTSLEELYLPSLLVPEDLSVLADLTSLKHLQIPTVVRSVTGPIGFDDCPTLESITFFGVPDKQTWREVSRLPKLKRVAIVDFESDETLTPEFIAAKKKALPGVELKVFKAHENETLIPKAFRDYRDALRKELRSDTKWLDEILKRE